MKKNKDYIINILIFIFFLMIGYACVFFHEAWFDESQAWLIAKNSKIIDIIKLMKYEGHSCLWYLILKIFTDLKFSYFIINYISLGIGVLCAYLVTFHSPFSNKNKLLLLFNPTIIYFSTVFGRPYILSVLLLILICIFYKKRFEKPILYGIIIALFVNTHILTFPIAGSLILIDLYELIKTKNNKKSTLIFTSLSAIGVIIFLAQVIGSFTARNDLLGVKNSMTYLVNFIINSEVILINGLYNNWFLCIPGLMSFILLLINLKKNKKSIFILSFCLMYYILFYTFVYMMNEFKAIYIILTIVLALWIYLEETDNKIDIYILIFLILMIPNTISKISFDLKHSYDPGLETAIFIEQNINHEEYILSVVQASNVIAYTDNYHFIDLLNQKEYTYGLYNDISNIYSIEEYMKNNNIKYILTISITKIDDLEELIENNLIEKYYESSKGNIYSIIIYKVVEKD